MFARIILALSALSLVAGCTSAEAQKRNRQVRAAQTFLKTQGSIGDPGRVAAADLAMAKAAREDGTWTALRDFAADDAVMDSGPGYAPAAEVLSGRADPVEPLRWAPSDVWSSCDGRLAVTLGRFLRPNGLVGDYLTVWQLQDDNSYAWIYDTGTPDDPQPAPEPAADIPDGAIVVPGLRALQGRVADCPRSLAEGETYPELPLAVQPFTTRHAVEAPDKSLMVTRYLGQDGSRSVAVHWVREGEVQLATSLDIPAP